MSLITLDSVDAGYGENQVLYDLSMDIEQERVNTIIGPNGSGKSTSLKSICGLVEVWDGTVEILGEDMTNAHPQEVVKRGAVMLPQGGNVFPDLTVQENLRMGAYLEDDEDVLQSQYEQVYDMFPALQEKRDQPASDLSGGQQMMVAFGRAIMPEPNILLLDEPSAGLAPHLVDDVFEQVERLKEAGMDMIIIEQNVRRVLEVADYVYVLDQGQCVFDGGVEELRGEKDIMEMYIGERHGN